MLTQGRCDVWYEFQHATTEQVVAAFKHFYLPLPKGAHTATIRNRQPEPSPTDPDTIRSPTGFCMSEVHRIEGLAQQFAIKVQGHKLAVAQLQGFFLRYMDEPEDALTATDGWLRARGLEAAVGNGRFGVKV